MFLMAVGAAEARDLKIATWNAGWHLSKAEAAIWIAKCSQPFALNAGGTAFEPAATGKPGWELDWDRNASIKPQWDFNMLPPCNVYQDRDRNIVPVTAAAYDKRITQMATFIADKINPDVIAFQEVSGQKAVEEILPNGGANYKVCSFEGFKVQRLAFAWRKEFGEGTCDVEQAVSLPGETPQNQVRPGFSLKLTIDGKPTTFLSVHLKSSCVSPLDASASNPTKGKLEQGEDNCKILQQQPVPLETWIERTMPADGRLIMMGDFNRSLWFESQSSDAVRTDGSDPTTALPGGVKVINLIKEINDGAPTGTKVTLLHEACPGTPAAQAICDDPATVTDLAKRKEARRVLPFSENLGCRNPIELDHILIGSGFTAATAEKVSIGRMGGTLPANDTHPDPLLSISDHCPLTAVVSD
jgi:endonuclease/exonuclease/phosphatase family metal-dependent hydrolase